MNCWPRRSLNRVFLSRADDTPAVPLAESLVSFSVRSLSRLAARCIAGFVLLLTCCPRRRSLICLFLSPADNTPTVPLAESLVPFSYRRRARRAACSIAHFFIFFTTCPLRRSPNRAFLSPADDTPVAPLAESLVSLSF
jgi:hypothetical protein